MPFEKGHKKAKGRPKGVPNKATAKAKEAIAAFVDGNAHRLNGLLDRIEAEEGPKEAFNAITSLLEYHLPKLARTESRFINEDGTDRAAVEVIERVVMKPDGTKT